MCSSVSSIMDPDSQTALSPPRNTASGCNAVRSLHQNTGFEVGKTDAHSCKPARPFSDDPKRCIRRTTTDCRGCRSSRAGCRLGRCGNRRLPSQTKWMRFGSTDRPDHIRRRFWPRLLKNQCFRRPQRR